MLVQYFSEFEGIGAGSEQNSNIMLIHKIAQHLVGNTSPTHSTCSSARTHAHTLGKLSQLLTSYRDALPEVTKIISFIQRPQSTPVRATGTWCFIWWPACCRNPQKIVPICCQGYSRHRLLYLVSAACQPADGALIQL